MEVKRINPQTYHKNPRTITKSDIKQLAKSLEKIGDVSGIIFNRTTNQLVGGNQRNKIMKLSECDIHVVEQYAQPDKQGTVLWGFAIWKGCKYNFREVEWDLETEKHANIVANKMGGRFDWSILTEHWTKEELKLAGFKSEELKAFMKPDQYKIQDSLPKSLKKIHSKKGDIYQLNQHILVCGSSTSQEAYMAFDPNEIVDCICTDPPYNVNYQSNAGTIENDSMPDSKFSQFLFDFYKHATARLKPGGVWYVFHADSKGHIFRNQFISAGNYLAQCLIWVKNSHVMGRSDYQWKHEPCLYGFRNDQTEIQRLAEILSQHTGQPPAYFITNHEPILYGWRTGAAHSWKNDRSQNTVLNFPKPPRNDSHPTMKPVPLISYLICNNTNEDQIVLDPFAGSGSCLIACESNNRTFRGIELEPGHIDTIVRRYAQFMKENEQPFFIKKNNKDITKQKWIDA